jgi:hypothetical protein
MRVIVDCCNKTSAEIAFKCNFSCQPTERREARRGSARLSLIGGARAEPRQLNRHISQPNEWTSKARASGPLIVELSRRGSAELYRGRLE